MEHAGKHHQILKHRLEGFANANLLKLFPLYRLNYRKRGYLAQVIDLTRIRLCFLNFPAPVVVSLWESSKPIKGCIKPGNKYIIKNESKFLPIWFLKISIK